MRCSLLSLCILSCSLSLFCFGQAPPVVRPPFPVAKPELPALVPLFTDEELAKITANAQADQTAPAVLEPFFTYPPALRSEVSTSLVNLINATRHEILINTYAITDIPIVQALIRARITRGVAIIVLLEPTPSIKNYRVPAYLAENNVLTAFCGSAGFNNNTYAVFDRTLVVTGSYQLTQTSATQNAENIIFIKHTPTALKYYRAFAFHLASSVVPELQLLKNPNTIRDILNQLLRTY